MANATSRPEAPVFRSTESCILYGLEATHGVPVTPSIYSDRVTKGRIYAHPNVQTRRHVGGRVDRRGGIIRAGMDGLDLEVRRTSKERTTERRRRSDDTEETA